MKKLIPFFLVLSLTCYSQEETYNRIPFFVSVDSLRGALIERGYTVTNIDNGLFCPSVYYGMSEFVKFLVNPMDRNVYKMVRVIPEQKNVNPFRYHQVYRDQIIKQTGAMPYEENLDPQNGEVYSKWVRGYSLITCSVNYKNQVVYTDERIFGSNMICLYDQKPTR
jgi:hypothetical protein